MKLVLRFLVLTALIASLPTLLYLGVGSGSHVLEAEREYSMARADLKSATREMEKAEGQLQELTTDVHAVEDEVRRQMRMVRPGETLVLVDYGSPAPMLSQRFPAETAAVAPR